MPAEVIEPELVDWPVRQPFMAGYKLAILREAGSTQTDEIWALCAAKTVLAASDDIAQAARAGSLQAFSRPLKVLRPTANHFACR